VFTAARPEDTVMDELELHRALARAAVAVLDAERRLRDQRGSLGVTGPRSASRLPGPVRAASRDHQRAIDELAAWIAAGDGADWILLAEPTRAIFRMSAVRLVAFIDGLPRTAQAPARQPRRVHRHPPQPEAAPGRPAQTGTAAGSPEAAGGRP
jgi:hypothetical protein